MGAKKIKLLIIDDEEMVSEMLKDYLEDYGFSVKTAINGEEGLKLIAAEEFDAAIVDIRLPDMDGNDVVMQAHKIRPGIKYFIHTGSLDYRVPEELSKLGLQDDSVLRKPVRDMDIVYNTIVDKVDKPGKE
ncbi:MAG: response regulator [bacterium]|nr:response regulator [bacterium]